MSREAYQVPTQTPAPGREGGAFGALSVEEAAITYICGDCNAKVALKRGDPIRCKECGHRVLYKERTKRYVCFEKGFLSFLSLMDGMEWVHRGQEDEKKNMRGITKFGRDEANMISRMVQFEAR